MKRILSALLIFTLQFGFLHATEPQYTENERGSVCVKPEDFEGANISGKIANALNFLKECNGGTIIFKDNPVYLISEAIALPSNTKMIVDGCKIKLADNIFDNIIRSGNLDIDPENPNGYVKQLLPAQNIRIVGLNGAEIEGAENFYEGVNPKTGVKEKWLGDYWGWRNYTILLSFVDGFEISGLKVSKLIAGALY